MFRHIASRIVTTRILGVLVGLLCLMIFLTACNTASEDPTAPPPLDKLGEIQTRGTVVIATDPEYFPYSYLKPRSERAPDTKCSPDQTTADELDGFDIDTAREVSARLGVEPCFVFPAWTLIISGSWADRWDIAINSMAITPERMDVLYFVQPYYTSPATFFVHKDNTTIESPEDLSGKNIGVCAGCTYEYYLTRTLVIPGQEIDFKVDDPVIQGYDTEPAAFDDLEAGDGTILDGILAAVTTGQAQIDQGRAFRQLGDPVFVEFLAPAIDRKASKDTKAFLELVIETLTAMHQDGTMLELSMRHFEQDFTTAAGDFDITLLNQ